MHDLRRQLATTYLRRPVVIPFNAPRIVARAGNGPQLHGAPIMGASGRDYFLGDDGTPQPPETWGETAARWWSGLTSTWHRVVYQGAAAGASGVMAPREVLSPAAARAYLADALGRIGSVYGWPADEVARRADAMRAAGDAATVVQTIERCKTFGPPATWANAQGWYGLADEMQRSAALVSAAEASGLVRSAGGAVVDAAREAAQQALQRIDQGLTVAQGASTGVGLAIGAGVLAVGAFFAWPYIGPALALRKR